jgi:hypothetical protein
MQTLFPLRQVGKTNWWGSHQNFTNAASNIVFQFGFDASHALIRTSTLYWPTNYGPMVSTGTNYTEGTPLSGVLLFGDGAKIGGPAGTIGNMAIGQNATAWADDFAPVIALGPNTLVTNNARVAIGISVVATNDRAYSLFGSASEDLEMRIGDAANMNFVRFGPPIKHLNTITDSTNVWRGDVSYNLKSITSLANGTNVLASATNVIITLDGSISADSWLAGWQGGREGKSHRVYNNSGFNIAFLHDSGFAPLTTDRFRCPNNRDAVLQSGGSLDLWYSPAAGRWIVANVFPENAGLTLSTTLSADNTTLSCTNVTFYRVTSNSAVATDRTVVLTPGTYMGQELVIESVGANAWELIDDSANTGGGNNRLSATFTAGQHDTITLKFNGTDWLERSRSAN